LLRPARFGIPEAMGSAMMRRPAALGLALGVAGLFSACTTTPLGIPPAPEPDPAPADATPPWVGRELSWEKLEAIETWLSTAWTGASAYWVNEARLQLGEGRVEFAKRDAADGHVPDDVLEQRLLKARTALERIVASPEATSAQRNRATVGLAVLDDLADGPQAVEPAAHAQRVARQTWGARPADAARLTANPFGWKRITVHHSAEPYFVRMSGSFDDSAVAVRLIQKAHMTGEGYGDIGYHFLIDPTGRVFVGRELAWQGAHAGGTNNVQNLGICLLGNFDRERPTREALLSLETLVAELRAENRISAGEVHAHLDYRNTECPGRYLLTWVRAYSSQGPQTASYSGGF